MITLRKANDRGITKTDWLNSLHTFSFADYHNPDFNSFSHLLVINEDVVLPGKGFNPHSHRDMEIISYVIHGALTHQDSTGIGSMIKPGEIQRMSAGHGITHSEFNHSQQEPVHFLQIWITPEKKSLPPSYMQKTIANTQNEFILIGSRDGRANTVIIHQDVNLYAGYFSPNFALQYSLLPERCAWLQIIHGKISINGQILSSGDGAAIIDENILHLNALENTELLFFDLLAPI